MRKAYYDLKRSKDGQYYFCLVAANGQVVSTSEMYPSKRNAERGIAAVRRAAGTTEVKREDDSPNRKTVGGHQPHGNDFLPDSRPPNRGTGGVKRVRVIYE